MGSWPKKIKPTLRLDVQKFGISMGVVCAISLIAITILASTPYGFGSEVIDLVKTFYPGYSKEPAGMLIGAIWAFIDGLVFGALLAYIYNYQLK